MSLVLIENARQGPTISGVNGFKIEKLTETGTLFDEHTSKRVENDCSIFNLASYEYDLTDY